MQDRGDVGVDGEKIAPIIILLYRLSRNKSQSINLIFFFLFLSEEGGGWLGRWDG